MTDLSLATIRIARGYLGVQETVGIPNRGPNVDEWLSFVGIHPEDGQPGMPWCAAFSSWCCISAAAELHLTLEFRRSAGALRLLDVNADLRIAQAEEGALVVWDHGGGKGHVGIVTGVTSIGGEIVSFTSIAGNTNAEGSRDADSVVERGFPFPQARTVSGYMKIA